MSNRDLRFDDYKHEHTVEAAFLCQVAYCMEIADMAKTEVAIVNHLQNVRQKIEIMAEQDGDVDTQSLDLARKMLDFIQEHGVKVLSDLRILKDIPLGFHFPPPPPKR